MVVMEKGKIVRSRVDGVRATGRDTSGVRGMDVDQPDNAVLVMVHAQATDLAHRQQRQRG